MNPGKLNKKIEIQKFEKYFDSEGIEQKNLENNSFRICIN